MEKLEEIKELLLTSLSSREAVLGEDLNCTPKALIINPDNLLEACKTLQSSQQTYFDFLACLTGIDNGPEKGTLEVVYNLYSIPYDASLMLKVELPRQNPKVDSVASVWRTADWHEREAYDLIGIKFEGHPDLRRILMPADWEGHPLRKDYVEPERYRGMETVRKEEN